MERGLRQRRAFAPEVDMEDERTTYRAIREWAMDSAYDACRTDFKLSEMYGIDYIKNIDIFGGFFSETQECFETDLEELMWRTLEMILDRGLGPQAVRDECTRIINNILGRNTFDDLVRDIPEDEANELRRDLKLLKFIE
jgi:hypothetical protein